MANPSQAPAPCGSCVAASGLLEDRAATGTPWNKERKVQGSQSVSRYWYGSDFHKTLPHMPLRSVGSCVSSCFLIVLMSMKCFDSSSLTPVLFIWDLGKLVCCPDVRQERAGRRFSTPRLQEQGTQCWEPTGTECSLLGIANTVLQQG